MINPLDDFLSNSHAYNAAAVAKTIISLIERSAVFTGGKIDAAITGIDSKKSIRDVLSWCVNNPQNPEKISRAIDLMVSGWERAKLMELMESQSANA